jgi:tetratricopeptide (TPR) repeat protein
VSKATTIRKRALELVRQQDWPNAIKEYRRLVELDQNNPNVHNELADLYLKTGQRAEAFESFALAVDEYTRVGLYNNAVAVCKKVLRVLPSRVEVLNKLGLVRMRQGLTKEAESYYISFLEKAASGSFDPAVFAKLAAAIAEEIPGSTAVLQRLGQCLLGYRLNEEAGDVFIKLYLLHEKLGESRGREDTRGIIDKLGFAVKLEALRTADGMAPAERTVVTENTLWTQTHSEGERIDVESTPQFAPPPKPTTAPAPQPAGAVPGGPSERDQWLLRLARGVGGSSKKAAAPAETPAPAPTAVAPEFPETDVDDVEDSVEEAVEIEAAEPEIDEDVVEVDDAIEEVMPSIPESPPAPVSTREASPVRPTVTTPREQSVQISALIQDDDPELAGEADYRSHYDLGMAYIEMDLLSEAIREYQIASKSPQFQVKCLEMIGLCFLKQNQPQLAIRQLNKGLSLIDNESEESMGIKYNLGLAYELVGDLENARVHFEDVYVVDVTFRDVAEKIAKLSGS